MFVSSTDDPQCRTARIARGHTEVKERPSGTQRMVADTFWNAKRLPDAPKHGKKDAGADRLKHLPCLEFVSAVDYEGHDPTHSGVIFTSRQFGPGEMADFLVPGRRAIHCPRRSPTPPRWNRTMRRNPAP